MIKSRHIIFLFIFFLANSTLAQTDNFDPKGSLSVDVGIPTKGNNRSFGLTMEGLFNGGVGYQYNVFNGITVGGGVKYSFFVLNPFAINNVNWNGGIHIPSAYAKLGYEKFTSDRFSFNFSVRGGYAMMMSVHGNDSCQVETGGSPYMVNTYFVEPQIELMLLTEKFSAHGFSFVLGYDFVFTDYGPEYLCLGAFPGQENEDYEGITRFLSIGFGYRRYFGRN